MKEVCETCGGDGVDRCGNPDHGIIHLLSFRDEGRLGCPVCGHDELYRVKNRDGSWAKCEDCNGVGFKDPQNTKEV